MIKSIIKEICIIILLIIAITLFLVIMLYNYIPTSKKIPSQVAEYELPQEMQEELNETIKTAETQNIVKTYRVDSTDLAGYQRNNLYNKGKTNPFDAISDTSTNPDNTTNNTETSQSDGTQGNFLNVVK